MNLKLIFKIWIFNSNLKIDISILEPTILIFLNIKFWNLIFDSKNPLYIL
jgi:hypothetical protein